jgi:dihydropteroate synthase
MQNSSVEDTNFNDNHIKINGILMDFTVPKIMGILNVTEDSFYEGSRLKSDSELLKKAEQHLSAGAAFLDLGGFSTRPNALLIEESIELKRVQSAVRQLKQEFPQSLISVDTFRASVAQSAIDEGAVIINDISGFQFDNELIDVISKNNVAYVLMHVEGTFETMHKIVVSQYDDIVKKVSNYFTQKISLLKEKNITNIILDPGFGFSKTIEENHELLHRMDEFHVFKKPILAGISRKSMVYKKINTTPEESLNGTTVLNTVAVLKGAGILRVHDVKECKEVIDLLGK